MQTHYYPSIMSCVKVTYQEEGARGFFRGMIPPLVTVSIIKSVAFSVYEGSKKTLTTDYGFKDDTLPSLMKLATLSGGVSGAFIALFSCPLELVKIQRQLEQMVLKSQIEAGHIEANHVAQQSNSWTAAKQIVQRKGILGLWSGVGCHSGKLFFFFFAVIRGNSFLSQARDALGTGIYFGGYESMKRILSSHGSETGPMTHFLSGGFCGILSWLFVFPVDAIKTNLQKDIIMPKPKFKGVFDCTVYLVKKNGIKSLYRGLNVTLIRAFPIHALNFLVYEQVLKVIPPPLE